MIDSELALDSPGERLKHILDVIGFYPGEKRGRTKALHEYLIATEPELSGLKYTTVRSWHHSATPPEKTLKLVVSALSQEYAVGNHQFV